jgi:GNAT superfamily N-acetyltransferase
MENASLDIRELHDLNDELLLPWLDLYETAFPPEERNLVSDVLRALKPGLAASRNHHVLAATGPTGQLLGIAMYSCEPGNPVAIFWYLAMTPAARGRGYGSQFYQDVVLRVRTAGCALAFLEVEIPERTTTAEARQMADARIRLYRRLGARLLCGISYVQAVGPHHDPIPMHLMVHLMVDLTAEAAFSLGQRAFGAYVTQTGLLSFD